MSTSKLRFGFLSNHHRLTKQLDLDSLLPHFIAKSLITLDQKELIKNEATTISKVDKFLMILHRRGSTDTNVYECILKLLADPDVTAGQQLETLVKEIRQDSENGKLISKFKDSCAVQVEGHNHSLSQHEESLVKSLSVGEVLPQLISRGIVGPEENDHIRKEPLADNQARLLLDVVKRRGPEGYSNLKDVLSQSDTQSHLANLVIVEGAGIDSTGAKHGAEATLEDNLSSIDSSPLGIDKLTDVYEVVFPMAASWQKFGVKLAIPIDKIEAIEAQTASDVEQCLLDVVKEWLRMNYDTMERGEPCWRLLARASYGINGSVFKQIAEDHKVAAQPPANKSEEKASNQHTASVQPKPQPSIDLSHPALSQPPANKSEEKATNQHTASFQPKPQPSTCIDLSHPALSNRPTLKMLLLMKYTDPCGQKQKVRAEEQVASKWRKMGTLFDFSRARLDIWDTQYRNDQEKARVILSHWLADGSNEYTLDWRGFIDMCIDLEMAETAKTIMKAVIANYV